MKGTVTKKGREYLDGLDAKKSKRSDQQNKALHKFCDLLAEELNSHDLDVKVVVSAMKNNANVPWSGKSVKEIIWRPFQRALAQVESTTELGKLDDIDKIHQSIMENLMRIFPSVGWVDFPSDDRMI